MPDPSTQSLRLTLQATPEEVMRAVQSLEAFARAQGAPDSVHFALALALEECGSNIVNHACQRDPSRTFEARFESTPGSIAILLLDDGPPFDPTAAQPRATSDPDDDSVGGWGIQLVRRHMDDIHYERAGNRNVLRLTKRLAPKPPNV